MGLIASLPPPPLLPSLAARCIRNAVFLRYCDGGSFSGSNATSTVVSNTTLWFRGKHVLKAMMSDLVGNRGLAAGTDVVVSGCSAGGLATFLHIDHWAAGLSTEAPKAKVRGMPDSGFFLDREAGAKYHSNMIWVFDWMNSTSGVNDACISANAGIRSSLTPSLASPTESPSSSLLLLSRGRCRRSGRGHGWWAERCNRVAVSGQRVCPKCPSLFRIRVEVHLRRAHQPPHQDAHLPSPGRIRVSCRCCCAAPLVPPRC